MPFEFLYLLCNARPRMEILNTLTVKKMDNEMKQLGEFMEGEERRKDLEQIYPFDVPGNRRRYNPRHQLQELHSLEAKDVRVTISDMRNLMKKDQRQGGSQGNPQ